MAVDGQRFMTKTQHYRKVTKPLLERKRRARMNLYLDELKDLIVDTMEAQGEHVSKLEKADILEMTVQYLKMHKQDIGRLDGDSKAMPPPINMEKFKAGYTQAAYEVSKVFATGLPGLDLKFGSRLMQHLGYQLKDLKQQQQQQHSMDVSMDGEREDKDFLKQDNNNNDDKGEDVWRPW